MKQKDARFLHPVIQQELRHEAVEMFLNGKSKVDISKHLCVSRKSVYKWVKAYENSGENGLKNVTTRPSKRYSAETMAMCTNSEPNQKL